MENKNESVRPKNSKAAHEQLVLDAVQKIIGSAHYNGPLIIFDVRDKSLVSKEIDRNLRKSLIAMVADYIGHFEQMNSLILADDYRDIRFYANRDICEILSGKYEDLRWASVLMNVRHFLPMARHFEEVHGVTAASHCATQGYCFTLLEMNSVPLSYLLHNGERLYGVENYLPEVLYWVMETLIDRNMYYPRIHNDRKSWHGLSARTVPHPRMLDFQQVWHKLLPVK